MVTSKCFSAVVALGAVVALSTPASGQTMSAEQVEVWNVIQAQWQASMEKDATWPERFLHDRFLGWSDENPTPRNKSSTEKWMRYDMENSTVLVQELVPIGIVVERNTAVAHYFYTVATEDRKGERRTTNGRYTDVLVKENGTWRFLAWRGGDDPGAGN